MIVEEEYWPSETQEQDVLRAVHSSTENIFPNNQIIEYGKSVLITPNIPY